MSKTVLFTEAQIAARVNEMAASQAEQHKTKHPGEGLLMIALLKGAAMFANDFQRALWRNGLEETQMEYFQMGSYGQETTSSGQPKALSDIDSLAEKVAGKHVMVVEDIIETGHTLATFLEILKKMGALSVVIVVLIAKGDGRVKEVEVDEVGFTLEGNPWIEGGGVDTLEWGRGNPDIVVVNLDEESSTNSVNVQSTV
jgi:hypoxanthine phosphoribosyltransferase